MTESIPFSIRDILILPFALVKKIMSLSIATSVFSDDAPNEGSLAEKEPASSGYSTLNIVATAGKRRRPASAGKCKTGGDDF